MGPSALRFNGHDTQVAVTINGTTHDLTEHFAPRDALTFEAWVRPSRIDKTQFIASVENYGWGVSIMCNAATGTTCCGDHVDGAIGFWTHSAPDRDNCANTISSDVGLEAGVWKHVAVVVSVTDYDFWGDPTPRSVKFYIDGMPAGSEETSPDDTETIRILNGTDAKKLYFGRFGACKSMHYDGLMDEMKLWRAALDTTVIYEHMTYGVLPWHVKFNDSIAYYKFDRAHGDVVYDSLYFYRDPDNFTNASNFRNLYDGVITTTDDQRSLWDATSNRDAAYGISPPPAPASPPPQLRGPSAVHFNGVRSIGVVNFDPAFAPMDAFTFEAWIRPERIDVMQHIAGIGNGGWAVSLLCSAGGARDSTTGCCGNHADGTVGFFTERNQTDIDSACAQQPASNGSVVPNTWNHIAVTVNHTGVSFYINGSLSGEITQPIPWYDVGGSGDLTLGAYIGGDEMPCYDGSRRCSFYAGEMDEVKFWHARLAANTVDFHKDHSFVDWHPNAGDLIAYYKFDQARGRVAYEYFHTEAYVMRLYSSDDDNVLWNNVTKMDAPPLGTPSPPPAPSPPTPPPPAPPAFPPAPPNARGNTSRARTRATPRCISTARNLTAKSDTTRACSQPPPTRR